MTDPWADLLHSFRSFRSFRLDSHMSISESQQAAVAADALARGRVVVVPVEGEPVEVPESVVGLLKEVLGHVQRGERVRVVAEDVEITTQQAAELLNVSRPYLVKMVDRGEIPSRKVGTKRRLKLADVLLYRDIDLARRKRAVDELAAEAQALGLY